MTMTQIRIGHVALIILALIIIGWNITHNGNGWLTLLNIAIVAVNLIMLRWWRGL
jgi:hypothetical protein